MSMPIIFAIFFTAIIIMLFFGIPNLNSIKKYRLNIRHLHLLLMAIFACLCLIKMCHLFFSGSIIKNELNVSSSLSEKGSVLFNEISKKDELIEFPIAYERLKSSINNLDYEDNNFIFKNLIYLNQFKKNEELWAWIKDNYILLDDEPSWRGRVIHHYSTILFTFREIENGNLSYLINSQYGLVSLLPLFFINEMPFQIYNVVGLACILVLGIYLIYKSRLDYRNVTTISLILILVILTCNIGALRISPGFISIRYIPLAILLYQFSKLISNKQINYITFITCGLINSPQFNILFILIIIITYFLFIIDRRGLINKNILKWPLVICFIAILQIWLYKQNSNEFTPPLFSSVGEDKFSILFAISILAFPLVNIWCLLRENKILNEVSECTRIKRNRILFATVAYAFCASYTLSFLKSPQHHSGFLIMSLIAIYILLCDSRKSKITLFISLFLLISPTIYLNYLDFGKRYKDVNNSYFDYKYQIGNKLNFKTAMQIEDINNDYDLLIKNYKEKGKIYFISKDKAFIEIFKNKNLDPKIYDIYSNLLSINAENILIKLKNEKVNYLILENKNFLDITKIILSKNKSDISKQEFQYHSTIINTLSEIHVILKQKKIECSQRYCIYQIFE
jgi:hypothetical protein